MEDLSPLLEIFRLLMVDRQRPLFQMQDINTAFDYIPDETNDCVIYTKEPVPIEIVVKPVKKELLYKEE